MGTASPGLLGNCEVKSAACQCAQRKMMLGGWSWAPKPGTFKREIESHRAKGKDKMSPRSPFSSGQARARLGGGGPSGPRRQLLSSVGGSWGSGGRRLRRGSSKGSSWRCRGCRGRRSSGWSRFSSWGRRSCGSCGSSCGRGPWGGGCGRAAACCRCRRLQPGRRAERQGLRFAPGAQREWQRASLQVAYESRTFICHATTMSLLCRSSLSKLRKWKDTTRPCLYLRRPLKRSHTQTPTHTHAHTHTHTHTLL